MINAECRMLQLAGWDRRGMGWDGMGYCGIASYEVPYFGIGTAGTGTKAGSSHMLTVIPYQESWVLRTADSTDPSVRTYYGTV